MFARLRALFSAADTPQDCARSFVAPLPSSLSASARPSARSPTGSVVAGQRGLNGA
ncbi:hypothetical protein SCATT_47020 [Streptantibioticus cattleyicolor NRRL 8057 = DSM 46488]|uniref:Uncharacterized protein n=1 Tax=Streptantibioticus cattleyicolor (strain ATCC 35852 / DSM 46488 / JCM 4925 / NBRC 14057 / NRRL 8057) TaxID=1003195 RepID=G8WT50_STREN|nr:hypothetical protein SCATT_47020 [Streptantibioticus cattleyicolor NRRL 8057 = DSM 46488]